MDTLLSAVQNKQNVIFTSLGGVERTRFLLRAELLFLSRFKNKSLNKIFHIVTWDANVTKTFGEARLLSFEDLGFKLAKLYGSESEANKSDSAECLQAANLIVCPIKYIIDAKSYQPLGLSRENALVVFDGVPLDSIEGNCCDLSADLMPGPIFSQMSNDSWSVILACNKPVKLLEAELNCSFPVLIDREPTGLKENYSSFASIITAGPTGVPMSFVDNSSPAGIHDEVGEIVAQCAQRIDSGCIVIFLPSYGQMIEYHNNWKKSGLFERIGLPYMRENRGEGQLRRMLLSMLEEHDKFIALISHRFHQEIHLADCVLSSAVRLVVSVGLPYPFPGDAWDARRQRNDSLCAQQPGSCLSGAQLRKYRAIEFMNGLARKCLDEFRHRDCGFLILDEAAGAECAEFTHELGPVQAHAFGPELLARFEAWARR